MMKASGCGGGSISLPGITATGRMGNPWGGSANFLNSNARGGNYPSGLDPYTSGLIRGFEARVGTAYNQMMQAGEKLSSPQCLARGGALALSATGEIPVARGLRVAGVGGRALYRTLTATYKPGKAAMATRIAVHGRTTAQGFAGAGVFWAGGVEQTLLVTNAFGDDFSAMELVPGVGTAFAAVNVWNACL
jgi:hypothetical protein